jgi:hypothetical protein
VARRRLKAGFAALAAGLASAGCGHGNVPAADTASGSARDCGTVVADTPQPARMDCFDTAFKSCTPARVLVDNRGAALAGTKVRYTIRGRSGSDCRVRWSYVALPANPKWVGKDIECPYTAGANFQTALAARSDFMGCRGPLLSLLRG